MAIDCINIICKERKQFEERLKNNKFYFTVKKYSVVGSNFEKLKPRFNINGLELSLQKGRYADYDGTSNTMKNFLKMLLEQPTEVLNANQLIEEIGNQVWQNSWRRSYEGISFLFFSRLCRGFC